MIRTCGRCGRTIHGKLGVLLEHGRDCPMTEELQRAVLRFAKANGRHWRARLSREWMEDGDLGPQLRRVRNVVGPSGLYEIRLESFFVTDK